MATILPSFVRFEAEGQIIGRLLAGYGELELQLCNCVSMVISDLDAVFKAMFRIRGETPRIKIADALGRKPYAAHQLESEFSDAIRAMRYCLKIRNQYAHCQWYDDNTGKLAFVNLEEIAGQDTVISNLLGLTTHHVDSALLTRQELYFIYVSACLDYLNYEGRRKAGKLPSHIFEAPQRMIRPPLYLP